MTATEPETTPTTGSRLFTLRSPDGLESLEFLVRRDNSVRIENRRRDRVHIGESIAWASLNETLKHARYVWAKHAKLGWVSE